MRFRPLSCNPLADIGRTTPQFRSVYLAESEEFHAFSVNKKNVLEIDYKTVRFLFQRLPKRIDMLSCNLSAYDSHHETFTVNDSVDSAAHCGLSVQSFHFSSVQIGVATYWICQALQPCAALSARLMPQPPH
jgi:hypothetical protein